MIKKKDAVTVGKGYPDPEELLTHLFSLHEKDNLDKYEVTIHLKCESQYCDKHTYCTPYMF